MSLKSFRVGGSSSTAGSAHFGYSEGYCYHNTKITIYDMNSTWRSETDNYHMSTYSSSGTYHWINTGTSYTPTSFWLGTPVNESGCQWLGYHVHQQSGGGWTNPANYPDEDYCNDPYNSAGCSSIPDTSTHASMASSWNIP